MQLKSKKPNIKAALTMASCALLGTNAIAEEAEDKSWDFNEQLSTFSKELFKENAFKAIEKLQSLKAKDFKNIRSNLVAENKKIENSVMAIANEAIDLVESKELDLSDFYQGKNSIYGHIVKVGNGDFRNASESPAARPPRSPP